jgi:WD40 repeat protein
MVQGCAFSLDGFRVVSASSDRTLKLWDVNSAREIVSLTGHTDQVTDCAFSPDGQRILSASLDRTLKLWRADTGAELGTFYGHSDGVNACAFSPDGRLIVSASSDGTLKLWEASNPQDAKQFRAHGDRVTGLSIPPGGHFIVSGSTDGTLKVWDGETGENLSTLEGQADPVNACAVAPNGERVVSACGGSVKLWDIEHELELTKLDGRSATSCDFSPDGKQIVSLSGRGELRLWESATGRELTSVIMPTFRNDDDWAVSCAFSPNGRSIAALSDKFLCLWLPTKKLRTARGYFTACAFSPDGHRIVSASPDGSLTIWDFNARRAMAMQHHGGGVRACGFSPDGRRVVSGSENGTVKLWSGNDLEAIATLNDSGIGITDCSFSPDGKLIATVSDALRLWHAGSGALLCEYAGSISVLGWATDRLVLGTTSGDVLLLRLENHLLGFPVVTGLRTSSRRYPAAWLSPVFWFRGLDKISSVHFGCPSCQFWSHVPPTALGKQVECAACGQRVELSPVTIDADWRPIAAAWRGAPEETDKLTSAQRELAQSKPGADLNSKHQGVALLHLLQSAVTSEAATAAMKEGCWQEALISLSEVIARDRRNARTYFYKAICHAKLAEGHLVGEGKNLEAARREISLSKLELALAKKHRSWSDDELRNAIVEFKNIEVLEDAVAIEEATTAMNAGRWQEALNSLSAIIAHDGRNARARYYSAILHAKLAEAHLAYPNENTDSGRQEISIAKVELTRAEEYCSSEDIELQNAIAELKQQLP